MSKIEWTDKTWNVITGCTQISPACQNCYAKTMTNRLQAIAKKGIKGKELQERLEKIENAIKDKECK